MISQHAIEQGQDALISESKPVQSTFSRARPPRLLDRVTAVMTWPARAFVSLLGGSARRRVAALASSGAARVLEVGIGSGASLTSYASRVHVTAVETDSAALVRARSRVAARALDNVHGLHRMATDALRFPDESFDHVSAFRAVYEHKSPLLRRRILRELTRVTRIGGSIILIERRNRVRLPGSTTWTHSNRDYTPGWIRRYGLSLLGHRQLDPVGLFVALRFQRTEAAPAG